MNGLPQEPANPKKRAAIIKQQTQARLAKRMGQYARNQRYKLYDDGRFYAVFRDRLEEKDISLGEGTPEAEAARKSLQAVHAEIGPWKPFR